MVSCHFRKQLSSNHCTKKGEKVSKSTKMQRSRAFISSGFLFVSFFMDKNCSGTCSSGRLEERFLHEKQLLLQEPFLAQRVLESVEQSPFGTLPQSHDFLLVQRKKAQTIEPEGRRHPPGGAVAAVSQGGRHTPLHVHFLVAHVVCRSRPDHEGVFVADWLMLTVPREVTRAGRHAQSGLTEFGSVAVGAVGR